LRAKRSFAHFWVSLARRCWQRGAPY